MIKNTGEKAEEDLKQITIENGHQKVDNKQETWLINNTTLTILNNIINTLQNKNINCVQKMRSFQNSNWGEKSVTVFYYIAIMYSIGTLQIVMFSSSLILVWHSY